MPNSKDPISFANYLGVDYKRSGNLVRIVCPFHNDTNPSMVLYEDHAYCYACGQGASLPWLASQVKGIPYRQALEELGLETLPVGEHRAQPTTSFQPMNFCEQPNPTYAKAFKEKHLKCLKLADAMDIPQDQPLYELIQWLKRKSLLDQAIALDWRWHDGSVFRRWGKGLLIPYIIGDNIVYERFRAYDPKTNSFEKPKGPYDVPIQPYFATFRPNSTCFIVEGESDAASVYAHGCSAIGVPGAVARKAINSAVAAIADRDYIDTIVCCGDNDNSGQTMNQIIREAAMAMCPRKRLLTYSVESLGDKTDLNDDHVNNLFHPDITWKSCYGDNYNRQPWADKSFGEFVDKFSAWADEKEANGDSVWTESK